MSCIGAGRWSFLVCFLAGRRLPAGIALVVSAERRLETVLRRAADYRPADAAAIAFAVGFGVDQETCQGVRAQQFEKGLRPEASTKAAALAAGRAFGAHFVEGLE